MGLLYKFVVFEPEWGGGVVIYMGKEWGNITEVITDICLSVYNLSWELLLCYQISSRTCRWRMWISKCLWNLIGNKTFVHVTFFLWDIQARKTNIFSLLFLVRSWSRALARRQVKSREYFHVFQTLWQHCSQCCCCWWMAELTEREPVLQIQWLLGCSAKIHWCSDFYLYQFFSWYHLKELEPNWH